MSKCKNSYDTVCPPSICDCRTKTLTDKEIQELAFEYLEKTDKGIVGVYDFVRAILQKANNG